MSDATATKEPQQLHMPIERWVVVGFTKTSDKKPAVEFARLSEIDGSIESDSFVYARKQFKFLHVGSVYTIEAKDGQCFPQTLRYQSRYADAAAVQKWQMAAAAQEGIENAERAAKKESNVSALKDALLPLRKLYQKTNGAGRAALEVQLLYLLRTGMLIEDEGE